MIALIPLRFSLSHPVVQSVHLFFAQEPIRAECSSWRALRGYVRRPVPSKGSGDTFDLVSNVLMFSHEFRHSEGQCIFYYHFSPFRQRLAAVATCFWIEAICTSNQEERSKQTLTGNLPVLITICYWVTFLCFTLCIIIFLDFIYLS